MDRPMNPRRSLTANEEVARGNVKWLCAEHAPKSTQIWSQKPLPWFVGLFVKKAFPAKKLDGTETFEHMWVKVTEPFAQKGVLLGTLANDPVLPGLPLFGELVEVKLLEIEDVLPPKSKGKA